jgi:hypothetical protein
LKPLKDLLDEQKIDTLWLAPSLAAVDVLTEDVGQQAYTLQRLAYTDSLQVKPGQIIFVDEAGLADAECIDLVGAKVEAAGGRLILIGDHKQNNPIQAGSPMRSLMEHGAETFKIWEILRQKDPIQKRAVELIAEGKAVESISLLREHGYVTEIQEPGERQQAIAAQYLKMPVIDQRNTLLITGTNAERLALTGLIRQGLKDQEVLGKSLDCIQLEDSRLTPEELTDLRNYEVGDYVSPARNYAKAKRHEFCKVVGKTERSLILEAPSGSTFELDPALWDKKKYTAGSINVAVGDELRLRGQIHGTDFQNGQIYTVKAIKGTIATLEDKKGKTRTIDVSRPVPVDHNIVRTTYDVQGSGKEGAILSLTDDRTSNQGATYVGISRQFEFLSVYTQNYDRLLKRIAQQCTHYNALDIFEVSNHERPNTRLESSREPKPNTARPNRDFAQGKSFGSEGGDRGPHQAGRGQKRHLSIGGISDPMGSRRCRDPEDDYQKARSPNRAIGSISEFQGIADEIARLRLEREIANQLPILEQNLSLSHELRQVAAQQQEKVVQLLAQLAQQKQETINAIEIPLQRMKAELQEYPEDFANIQRSRRVDVIHSAISQWQESYKIDPILKAETVIAYALEAMEEAIVQAQPKPFWTPNYDGVELPEGFIEQHWAEVTESAIDPRLIAGNMHPASGDWVTERLAKTIFNDPTVSNYSKEKLKEKYEPVVQGGIWFNGGYVIEALVTARAGDKISRTEWGAYKSFFPRIDEEKTQRKGELSYRKYENPIGQPREFFMPVVPRELADRIYNKYGINPTEAERESGLYYVALQYNLPIVVTEGSKKTLASLSQGYITVGMQGVNALYRARDENGNRLEKRLLNEAFACWATPGREITFAFDADTKESSIIAVRRAMVHSIELLQEQRCDIKVAQWQLEQGKGLDDLIVQSGPLVYDNALKTAQPPDVVIDAHYKYEYDRIAAKLENPTDSKIYAEMMATNPQDAERVIMQSEHIHNLKKQALTQEMIQSSIDQIKTQVQPSQQQRIVQAIDLILVQMGDENSTESAIEHKGYIIARHGDERGVFRAEDKQPIFRDGVFTDTASVKDKIYVGKLPKLAVEVKAAAETLEKHSMKTVENQASSVM